MNGKGQSGAKRKPANLDQISVVTNETNVPSPYFAGVRHLNVSWLMNPVIAFNQPSTGGGKGK